jgi:hypothetical protein
MIPMLRTASPPDNEMQDVQTKMLFLGGFGSMREWAGVLFRVRPKDRGRSAASAGVKDKGGEKNATTICSVGP